MIDYIMGVVFLLTCIMAGSLFMGCVGCWTGGDVFTWRSCKKRMKKFVTCNLVLMFSWFTEEKMYSETLKWHICMENRGKVNNVSNVIPWCHFHEIRCIHKLSHWAWFVVHLSFGLHFQMILLQIVIQKPQWVHRNQQTGS